MQCLSADGKAKLDVAFDLSRVKRGVECTELNGSGRAFRYGCAMLLYISDCKTAAPEGDAAPQNKPA